MKIALITEGASENRIVKHIIAKYFKGSDSSPVIRQIQPKVVNDRQETPGGWNEVLKYCKREELRDIFVEDNDYLVIQIDTDQCQTAPFSVSPTDGNNKRKSIEDLCADVRERLIGEIRPEIWEEYKDRILFAICVSEIECWLLPIFDKSGFLNCITKLNHELARKDMRTISPNDKNCSQSIRAYDDILRHWRKREDIEVACKHDASLRLFVDALSTIEDAQSKA